MADALTYELPMFPRLRPKTAWTGGRVADTDLLTLEEAARFASRHSCAEVQASDFLRSAARGEIPLQAIAPRACEMHAPRGDKAPLSIPAGSFPTLPLSACKSLSATGRASWRCYDAFEPLAQFGGALGRYVGWELAPDKPDLETTAADCRVTGWDSHALADAFKSELEPGPAPVAPNAIEPAPAGAAAVVRHSTKEPQRRDILDPVIELARSKCLDPTDTAQVLAQLAVLAQVEHPPLLASTADGIKYSKKGDDAYLTRDALDKRLHPERRQKRP